MYYSSTADDIILLDVEVSVGSTVEDNHSGFVLCVIEEVQVVATIGEMHQVAAMHGILGCAGGSCSLLNTEAIRVVNKADRFATLGHALQLTSLSPGMDGPPARPFSLCKRETEKERTR